MLAKLLMRSFRKQLHTYGVYFALMMLSVTIFYSFGAMTYDQPIARSVRQDIQIKGIMNFSNLVVGIVVLTFMLSANYFFVKRRQKEIGLFQLFGMSKGQILLIFLSETTLLNVASLVLGILTGIFFSKLFSMILIKAMNLNISSRFFISWLSMRSTVLIFLVSLIFIAGQNMWLLRRKQLSEFFQRTHTLTFSIHYWGFSRRMLALSGVLFIGIGYYLSLKLLKILDNYIVFTNDFSVIFWLPCLIFSLCVAGTFLFFAYTIPYILNALSQLKFFHYRALNSFVLNQAKGKIHQSWRILSLITIIIGLAIVFIGTASGFFALKYHLNALENPTTFQLTPKEVAPVKQLIQTQKGRIVEEETVTFKLTGIHLSQKVELLDRRFIGQSGLVNLVSETQYNRIRKLLSNAPSVHLVNSRQSVLFNQAFLISSRLSVYNKEVALFHQENLQIQRVYVDYFGNDLLRYTNNLLVVKDTVFQQVEGVEHQLIYLNAKDYDEVAFQRVYDQRITEEWVDPMFYQVVFKEGKLSGKIATTSFAEAKDLSDPTIYSGSSTRLSSTNRFPSMRLARREGGLFVFIAIFVGGIILISTVSSLLVRQFGEAEQERKNYELLRRLGVPSYQIRQAIAWQNAWIFFPVMILATSHGSMAIYTLTKLIPGANYWIVYLFGFLASIIFVFCYLLSTFLALRVVEET